jgi:hypothetical protein
MAALTVAAPVSLLLGVIVTLGVTSANVIASVTDDDTVGVTNSATAITLGEATTSTYTVVLNTQPRML